MGSLIFTACFCIPILWAAELTVPLPADALKVSEKTANFGPIKSVAKIYQSSWTPDKVVSFYKKEMLLAGWREGKDGVFTKDSYIIVVAVSPLKDEAGKITFSNTISEIPTKEEFFALPKPEPEKLNFMPVYPGSVQIFLLNSSLGVSGSYETERSIKEVVFFYKSGMLNYGWTLDNETPIKAEAINPANSKTASKEDSASLTFRRKNGESCTITIASSFIDSGSLLARGKRNNNKSASLPGKTIISVDYNAYQRIE